MNPVNQQYDLSRMRMLPPPVYGQNQMGPPVYGPNQMGQPVDGQNQVGPTAIRPAQLG